jgi:hypothetical protein
MRALFFLFCLTVPSVVYGADITFRGFDAQLDLPQGWKESFSRILRPYPEVMSVQFVYLERKVSGPQSRTVIVSVRLKDSAYLGGEAEDFLPSKYELARIALVKALKRIPRKSRE